MQQWQLEISLLNEMLDNLNRDLTDLNNTISLNQKFLNANITSVSHLSAQMTKLQIKIIYETKF